MNIRHSKDNRQIFEEASSWFVEFRTGQVDRAKRLDFMRWLQRSPEHIRAYMEISGAYAKLPGPGAIPDTLIERLVERTRSRSSVVPFDSVGDLDIGASLAATARERPVARRRAMRFAASIAMFLIVVAVSTWLIVTRDPTYVTQTAEQRSITLDDGSKVELNARTKIRVSFTPTQRRIDLLVGQALFHVAKDPLRPFIVTSSGTQVRAVGTRFDVHRRTSGTTVTVLEGRVAVLDRETSEDAASTARTLALQNSPTASTAPIALILAAGEQAIFTKKSIEKPLRPNIAAATAWTEGEFEFDETPLADVVEELNRYSRVPIVIESQAPKELRITGIYSSEDPGSLIRFLRNQPDLAVAESVTEIRIRQK